MLLNARVLPRLNRSVYILCPSHDMITQCITFVVSAFGTTSMAIASTLFYLAKNKDWQNRCHMEARQLLTQGAMDFSALKRLSVINMCLKEALRLNPSVSWTKSKSHYDPRTCWRDDFTRTLKLPIVLIHERHRTFFFFFFLLVPPTRVFVVTLCSSCMIILVNITTNTSWWSASSHPTRTVLIRRFLVLSEIFNVPPRSTALFSTPAHS